MPTKIVLFILFSACFILISASAFFLFSLWNGQNAPLITYPPEATNHAVYFNPSKIKIDSVYSIADALNRFSGGEGRLLGEAISPLDKALIGKTSEAVLFYTPNSPPGLIIRRKTNKNSFTKNGLTYSTSGNTDTMFYMSSKDVLFSDKHNDPIYGVSNKRGGIVVKSLDFGEAQDILEGYYSPSVIDPLYDNPFVISNHKPLLKNELFQYFIPDLGRFLQRSSFKNFFNEVLPYMQGGPFHLRVLKNNDAILRFYIGKPKPSEEYKFNDKTLKKAPIVPNLVIGAKNSLTPLFLDAFLKNSDKDSVILDIGWMMRNGKRISNGNMLELYLLKARVKKPYNYVALLKTQELESKEIEKAASEFLGGKFAKEESATLESGIKITEIVAPEDVFAWKSENTPYGELRYVTAPDTELGYLKHGSLLWITNSRDALEDVLSRRESFLSDFNAGEYMYVSLNYFKELSQIIERITENGYRYTTMFLWKQKDSEDIYGQIF